MTLIKWDDSLSVNVAQIDRQHKKLVDMINELHEAMKTGKGRDATEKIVFNLLIYAATHFRTEEEYFSKFGYPDANSHEIEHADFVRKVTEFKDDFIKGKLSLTIEIMNFLSDWLKNHIKGTDKKYVRFFNEKGLK